MNWTEHRDCQLRELWSDGKTAGEIAGVMGISRNAVLGRSNRLGLESRRSPIVPKVVRFAQMVDMVADFDAPLDLAAEMVGLTRSEGIKMWNDMCAAGGEQYR